MCVCVCERERERESDQGRPGETDRCRKRERHIGNIFNVLEGANAQILQEN